MLPLLIDFDGVIKIGNAAADDAQPFLKFISDNKIPTIILSNSTLRTGESVKDFLVANNMDFGIECLTTVNASLEYIKEKKLKISAFCNEGIKSIFKDFIDENNPDAVLIGDLEDKWSYDILNEIFRKVYAGAEIIAMQKNKFWKPQDKLCLDAGAFIAAIEYAANKTAALIGKPSPLYFKAALNKLGYKEDNSFIMIGDDIENDVEAAQKINGKGILIYTGKTKFPIPPGSKIKPDFESKNLTDAIRILKQNFI